MESFDTAAVVTAAISAVVAVLAATYSSWKAKVVNDGVQDWKDSVVEAIDKLKENK
jgi:hypothetical protein